MSIVYSVTVKPDQDIEQNYVQWLQAEHIQEVVTTGCFDDFRFFKVLAEDEPICLAISIISISMPLSCGAKARKNLERNSMYFARF